MIGLFDSGVGGLSVLRHVRARLPHDHLIYLADQAHVPYGARSAAEVRRLASGITRFLRAQGARIIVVACNTASAAALTALRAEFPDLPFVGMEPAVKPAAAGTRTGRVGVMATAGTFGSARYADLMRRYAGNIQVQEDPCPGLVELIEAGRERAPETAALLTAVLHPMLAAGVDTVVLGCTHYPFVRPLIEQVVAAAPRRPPSPVTIIDPAPAVAAQTARVLAQRGLLVPPTGDGSVRLVTTGPPAALAALAARLLGHPLPVAAAAWAAGRLAPAVLPVGDPADGPPGPLVSDPPGTG